MRYVTAGHEIESEVGICKMAIQLRFEFDPVTSHALARSCLCVNTVPSLVFDFLSRRGLSH